MFLSTSGTGAAHEAVPSSVRRLPPWCRALGSSGSSAAGGLIAPVQALLPQVELQRVNPAAHAAMGDSSQHPPRSQAAQVICEKSESARLLFDGLLGCE